MQSILRGRGETLVCCRTPSQLLHEPPGEYYTSPQIFEQEKEKVFKRKWLYVAHVSQVREPGDYVTVRAALESLIVTRDRNGAVRAYFNVCRHRGSQICDELSTGKAKAFVCPYHRWSYGLDGSLLAAPAMRNGEDFDYPEFGLQEAHCEVFYGSIYVWLGKEPEMSLRDQLSGGGMFPINDEKLSSIEPERVKMIHENRHIAKANWKIVMENNIECYHCASGHPDIAVVADLENFYYERGDDGELVACGVDSSFGLKEDVKTYSMDGERVCKKRLGNLADGDSFVWADMVMWSSHPHFCDYSQKMIVHPISVDTSEIVLQWFVHEDAVEGVDYEVKDVIALFSAVAEQDYVFVERQQRGVSSDRYIPGPNHSLRETDMEAALLDYIKLMEA